jgi:hypothetical protein
MKKIESLTQSRCMTVSYHQSRCTIIIIYLIIRRYPTVVQRPFSILTKPSDEFLLLTCPEGAPGLVLYFTLSPLG